MENKNEGIITRFWIDKEHLSLPEYEEKGGFTALKNILTEKLEPDDVVNEVLNSSLAGRGGGGFLTGKKWLLGKEAIEKADDPQFPAMARGYFICNADESEPGTYKDRLIIEKSPYLLLEGLIIGAWAVGADRGIIYINNSYKDTAHILRKCIKILEDANWLGDNIQNSGFNFHLEVFQGAGSYVCGEETALINSIEGKRGEPRLRPPFPIESGLFGRPTIVNNVESLANIPYIVDKGASAFLSRGVNEDYPGTKLYIINGPVNQPGVFEAPLGKSVNELVSNYADGLARNKELKCVQVGGAAGRFYAGKDLDKPLGYCQEDSVPVGSGSILVIDKSVDFKRLLVANSFFFRRESCGKCVPCREGTYQLHLLAERIMRRKLMAGDKERLEDLIFTMQRASFCPLGSFAVSAWESALELFPEELFGTK